MLWVEVATAGCGTGCETYEVDRTGVAALVIRFVLMNDVDGIGAADEVDGDMDVEGASMAVRLRPVMGVPVMWPGPAINFS